MIVTVDAPKEIIACEYFSLSLYVRREIFAMRLHRRMPRSPYARVDGNDERESP